MDQKPTSLQSPKASLLQGHYWELGIQLTIAVTVWIIWLSALGPLNAIQSMADNIGIVLTMLLGSFVAGSTSVGGGAVAFPVFTKILAIDSQTALIFSLAIQSIGMGAASLFIVLTKVPVCFRVIRYSTLYGGLGLIIGLFFVRLHMTGGDVKYLFSCFSLIVGVALLWSQLIRQSQPKNGRISRWLLIVGCFFGGLLSGIIGTGIDFILFTLMLFCWHYDFRKAVATSVVVMAINASIGFAALLLGTSLFTGPVVSYWQAAVPVVVIGAPLGALACRYVPKTMMIYFLLLLIVFDIVSTVTILGIRGEYLVGLATLFSLVFTYSRLKRQTP